ncbi:hypothetical protein [Nonomuraea sediminis]|uniref:hypothetical protein n=1 Tax=Nonomuraea sediminis TaxID=2835864 RepID=UPI001BDD0C50|nr:hypothetical protein [Nonomuraea sediminis]
MPVSAFPPWLSAISAWTPTNRYADLSWQVVFGGTPRPSSAVILLGWLAVFCCYAVYGYRRAGHSA